MITTRTAPHSETALARGEGNKLRALLVEDNPSDIELVLRELRRGGFEVSSDVAQTEAEFRNLVKMASYQIVLADYNLPQWKGMEALDVLREEGFDIPLILVSGAVGDIAAVDCIKRGASDYVLKDRLARLPAAVRVALQEKKLREEREQAERDLAQKVEELARSNQALEQFAYVASHDLQEPLRMVATYTQLLAERYRGKLDDNADRYIHYAVDGATRMQTLIQDLLAFSRAGNQGMNLGRTDCNAVVEQALKNLQAVIQESNALVKFDDLPVVSANTSQLTQVFQNLVGNALKFHGSTPPVIRIGAEEHGDEWLFSVTDNGIGIEPEHSEVIFDVFKRLHTAAEYPGNGIGLSICKRIIEQHGGKIWVADRSGKGATFQFTLPAAKARAAAGQAS
jgi:signal transduction histidine kinase